MKTQIVDSTKSQLVANCIKKGGCVCFKTDTVFGLSCLASNKDACKKLVKIKGRENKPLIILLGSKKQLPQYVKNISDNAKKIIDTFWPGPLTIVFESKYNFCEEITCGQSTIAIRIPKHSLTQKLLDLVGEPIVSTSANISGEKPLNSVEEVASVFKGKVDYIINDDYHNIESLFVYFFCSS